MALPIRLNKSNKKKKSEQAATYQRKKSSCDGSGNSLSLEKQVEILKQKTGTLFEQMAVDENVSFEQFYGGYARAKAAFRIMENVMQLTERMKQLKDGA